MCSRQIKKISLGLSGETYPPGIHICMLYRDETERREVISKYLESGFTNNEKIAYFTDIMPPSELRKWLEEIGIAIPTESHKQLIVTPALDVYCPNNKFSADHMLHNLAKYYEDAIAEGFSGARVTGETNWLTKHIPGCEHFIEYESLINEVTEKHPVTVMCQYDATRFDGGTIFDILQVHPLMLVHGQVVKNPAYIKPEEFLKEFKSRKK